MSNFKFQNLFILFISSALIFSACSDDATNSGTPPALPDLSVATPNIEYFNSNNKAVNKSNNENYALAQSLTMMMQSIITGYSSLPESFLASAQEADATFDNGVWTWEYSASGGGSSVSIRLTAEPTNSKTDWAMFISLDTQEIKFDNYKFFDGTTQNDGKTGDWSFYPFYTESTSPIMTYDWNIESDDVASFTITFDQDSQSSSTFGYVKNSPDNTISITDGATSTTTIYWNDTTQEGYYQASDEPRVCWDASSNNVPCTSS